MAELEREVDLASANSALDELRAELGLGPGPAGSASSEAPASPASSTPPPSGGAEGAAGGPTQAGS